MKAVCINHYGDVNTLIYQDIPKPTPKADELLIKVHAAGINPIDCKTRSGKGLSFLYKETFPLILGWDVSGVVEAVGEAVTAFKIGDAVYGMPRFPEIAGAYAEYITAPAEQMAHKPQNLNHTQAAAVPLVALTAWQALFDAANLDTGQSILIHAAAGGVGHIAVQLAKWKGTTVLGTASARNKDYLQKIGVDTFINYKTTLFEDVAKNVDVVLDCFAGEIQDRSWNVLKKNGFLVSILGDPTSELAATYGVRCGHVLVQPNAKQLTEIATLIDEGHLTPNIDATFPLADAAKAHTLQEKGHVRGKLVLEVIK